MRKLIFEFFIMLAAIITFSYYKSSAQKNNYYANDQLIVKFKKNKFKQLITQKNNENKFNIKKIDSLNRSFELMQISKLKKVKRIDNQLFQDDCSRVFVLKFRRSQNIEKLIQIYSSTELFEYVEPNYVGFILGTKDTTLTPNDSLYYNRQWPFYNDGTFSLSNSDFDADIDMDNAWEIEQGDSLVIIAILDSGTKLDHPEFKNRIWINYNEKTNNSKDDDFNGYSDDVNGWDFVNADNNPLDDHGHGTNISGIIGANGNNYTGYAGMNWNCKLMICKIVNEKGDGYYSWWANAILYAVDNGAKVINLSVGGISYSNLLKDAIDYAYNNNVAVITGMGNDNNNTQYYPAAYTSSIAVGATDPDDKRSIPFFWSQTSGSNYGPHIDVVAPGNYIYGPYYQSDSNYNVYYGGTSQAAAYVTGLTSLLIAKDPTRTVDDIVNILHTTSEDQVGAPDEDVSGWDQYYGYGRINAYNALLVAPIEKDYTIKENEVKIFPNPAVRKFKIVYTIHQTTEFTISLFNAKGQFLWESLKEKVTIGNYSRYLNLNNLISGIYYIQIETNDDKEKIIKKIILL